MSNTKINFTIEERTSIAEFVYSRKQEILIVSDVERLLETLNNHKLLGEHYESLMLGVKNKVDGIVELVAKTLFEIVPKEQGVEIMEEYFGKHSNAKQGDKANKAFYGTNVGKEHINLREYPGVHQLTPTRIYLKEDGAINNEPSFGILMTDPNNIAFPVIGQLSLNMLNEGLNDVGYTIRKQTDSVVIGEHIEGCNIKKLVDEQQDMAPNPWNVTNMRVIKYADEKGNEMTFEQVAEKGHAETWYEYPCFGQGCKCVKRVRVKAITQM